MEMDLFFGSDSSSSDDDEIDLALAMGGSLLKAFHSEAIEQRSFVNRHHISGHDTLFQHYFAENPKYTENVFRRRFRMNRDLFLRIKDAVEAHDSYFVQKRNAAGKLGLSSFQKITAALRILAYGVTGDLFDEYIQIAESTATKGMKRFVKAIVSIFGDEYLRRPNGEDIARLLVEGELRGTPGMLGSIDCLHWEWKDCPTQWSGMHKVQNGNPTIVLEAIASSDTWIWHASYGLRGCHSDINVLEMCSSELLEGQTAPVNFFVNDHNYDMGYYFADDVYPTCGTLVKTISDPTVVKEQHFAKVHESLRKDVERAVGVLHSRFAIIRGAARYYNKDDLKDIVMACIIMHNMIVESERHLNLNASDFEYDEDPNGPPKPEVSTRKTSAVCDFITRDMDIRDAPLQNQLQEDLVEHLWKQCSEP